MPPSFRVGYSNDYALPLKLTCKYKNNCFVVLLVLQCNLCEGMRINTDSRTTGLEGICLYDAGLPLRDAIKARIIIHRKVVISKDMRVTRLHKGK